MQFLKKENQKFVAADEKSATHVLIPIEEYNGYEKALRIVHDRALQQIEKSKADEHGYTPLRAEKRCYKSLSYAWLITRRTPYSIKIKLEDAMTLIERDLSEHYNLKEISRISANIGAGVYEVSYWERSV